MYFGALFPIVFSTYRVFSKGRIDHFLDFSWCFGFFLTIQYGRFFILVLLGHMIEKKSWKISSSKKARFQGWLKLAQFLLFEFLGLPTLGSIISGISPSILKILMLILLQISWIFWNSPNILNLYDFEGCYGQKQKKMEIRKYANLSQPWNLTFFEDETIQVFFSIICPKSTRMKNRPYWMVKKSPKHQEKSKKWVI